MDTERSCHCGQVTGKYIDNVNCTVHDRDNGNVILIGFNNTSLINAIRNQSHNGDTDLDHMNSDIYPGQKRGRRVEAFIIPDGAASVNRRKT
jgi:hypothetical protein